MVFDLFIFLLRDSENDLSAGLPSLYLHHEIYHGYVPLISLFLETDITRFVGIVKSIFYLAMVKNILFSSFMRAQRKQ